MSKARSVVCWDWEGPLLSTPVTPSQFRRELADLGLSQSECARRMYVTISTVQRWISGESKIPGTAVACLECWTRQIKAEEALRRVKDALDR